MVPADSRLFVPLATEPFNWFEAGEKHWELRRYGRQYTEKHVRTGRRVELRLGYATGRSLWGVIVRVLRADSVADFFEAVNFKHVVPAAETRAIATDLACTILRVSAHEPVIGFEVEIDK